MIRTYSFSAAGGHPVNEDAFVLWPFPGDEERWLLTLADGQGGQRGGARAAQLACQTASEQAARCNSIDWIEVLTGADAIVAADTEAGFTTLIGLSIRGNTLVGASCGDSAVLAICGSGQFHSLTARQFKNPLVGSGEATFIPFETKLIRPWKVLAMTDGVWKYAGWEKIRALGAEFSGEELLSQIQSAARLQSGQFPDDFTVVLLESE